MTRLSRQLALSTLALAALICVGCSTLTVPHPSPDAIPDLAESVPQPTLGGTQFWSDQYFFHDWRIQRRAGTDRYRLLDTREWQHAAGTFEECRAKLEEIKQEHDLPPMQGKAVVLLHGLAAPRWSMHLLGKHLEEHADYEVINVEYASTRCGIDEHAQSLANVLESLEGIDQIDLVGHSMGNIVIRRYLGGRAEQGDDWTIDHRIGRIVMIAPPNNGSLHATKLANLGLFKTLFGEAGQQLGIDWQEIEPRLATPEVPFAIIAGGFSEEQGFSTHLPGGDDGRITVETTLLEGATDFAVVPMMHEFIANDPRVLDDTLRFLEHGYLVSRDARHPLSSETIADRVPPSRRPARN